MSSAQFTEIVALAALILGIAAVALLVIALGRLRRLQRQQRVILGSAGERDIVRHVTSLDEKVGNLRTAVEDLGLTSGDHEKRIDSCLSRVGVIRFDAYDDLGGRQSTAIAFMDAKDDGVVVTTVISRDFARMYVKILRDGQPDVPLAPEEIEAVDQARAHAPFTIRPRIDASKAAEEEETAGTSSDTALLEDSEADRELERENRRRERLGLPALEELPPPPSTQGWQALPIPTDSAPVEQTEPGDGQEGETAEIPPVDAAPAPAGAPSSPTEPETTPFGDDAPRDAPETRVRASDLWFDDDDDGPDWPARRAEQKQ